MAGEDKEEWRMTPSIWVGDNDVDKSGKLLWKMI
jgi:hypothetical protein